jgi:outer membrane receptor protein involved in Fe transport
VDNWRNYDGHNLETTIATGLPAAGNLPTLAERDDTVVSPRAAVLYRFGEQVSAWGAVSTGFRAPTLNEPYRQFRVGALLTRANHELGPEQVVSSELGVNLLPLPEMTVRATFFDNRVEDPIFNLTIAENEQQRRNLERTRVRGLQTDVDYRLGTAWSVSAGYVVNDATVRESSLNPALVGNRLAQVPKHRGSVRVSWADARYISVGVGLQFIGRQFDDDLNLRTVPGETEPGMPGYMTADLTASREINRSVQVFFGIQNLFDEEYVVQTNPTTIGTPFMALGGVRVMFGR